MGVPQQLCNTFCCAWRAPYAVITMEQKPHANTGGRRGTHHLRRNRPRVRLLRTARAQTLRSTEGHEGIVRNNFILPIQTIIWEVNSGLAGIARAFARGTYLPLAQLLPAISSNTVKMLIG
jgi:hypothetical protein